MNVHSTSTHKGKCICFSCYLSPHIQLQYCIQESVVVSQLLILKITFFFHKNFPSGYKHVPALEPPNQLRRYGALSITGVASRRRQGCPRGSFHSKCDSRTSSSGVTWELMKNAMQHLSLLPDLPSQNLHLNKLLG